MHTPRPQVHLGSEPSHRSDSVSPPRRHNRALRGTVLLSLLALSGLLLVAPGCTTKAVAMDECREIEHLRCEGAAPCGIIDNDQIAECKRQYNDQCLHGIAGPKDPSADQQKKCVNLLEDARDLASETRDDESRQSEYDVACRTIAEPWALAACDFLNPEEENTGGSTSE